MPVTTEDRVELSTAWRLCCRVGRGPLLRLGLLALAQALLPVVGLYSMQWLVDAVASGVAGTVPAAQAWQQALVATSVAASVALSGAGLASLSAYVSETFGRRLADASVQHLQEHTAGLSLLEFERPGFHDAMQRAGAEASQRPVRLVQDLVALLVAALSLLAMSALLVRVEPWLPLAVGLAAAPIAWSRRKHAQLRFDWQRDHVVSQRAVAYLGGVLTGRATAKDVRALGLRDAFGARLCSLRRALRASLAALAGRRARDELLVHVVAGVALFGAYVVLADAALAGLMTLGGLVLHAQAAQRTQNAVRDLLAASAAIHEHRLFLRPLVDFEARRPDAAAPQPADRGELLALEDAAFRYPEAHRPALQGLRLRIGRGDRVAVIGANGSGKSTLIKLLAGLYPPSQGALRRAPEARVAVLLQDAAAFELTLRENLLLGSDEAIEEADLWQVLDVVGLGARVRSLPLGLDTPWSRRLRDGVDWSVGEARRMVLARELLRSCDALLLDEPFASLDGRAAKMLAEHLADSSRDRALVVVDHRGPALTLVDRVIWLDQGRVRFEGSPGELADEPGFAAQFPEWMQ